MEPLITPWGIQAASGFFLLCTMNDLASIMMEGIHGKQSGAARLYLEPFVPSDVRSNIYTQVWANPISCSREPPRLLCVSINPMHVLENTVYVSSSGRISLDANTVLSPIAIESIWRYSDTTFKENTLLYHKALSATPLTGFTGGNRRGPTNERLEELSGLVETTDITGVSSSTGVPNSDSSSTPAKIIPPSKGLVVRIAKDRYTDNELARWGTAQIIRCPNCFFINPGGMTFCFDCDATWFIKEEETYTALPAMCVPEPVANLAFKALQLSRSSLFGTRCNGVRSEVGKFWEMVRAAIKWRHQ